MNTLLFLGSLVTGELALISPFILVMISPSALIFMLIFPLIIVVIFILIKVLLSTFSKRKPVISPNAETSENSQTQNGNPVIIIQEKSNGVGTAGFILALIGLILCWVPVIDWILWILGAILSLVGCFKEPRGLAIAGLVISFIGIILIIAVVGALLSL